MDWSMEDSAALMALTGSASAGSVNASQGSGAMEVDEQGPRQCPHLASAFAIEATRVGMLKKYKNAVAWGGQTNTNVGSRPNKRRKVRV